MSRGVRGICELGDEGLSSNFETKSLEAQNLTKSLKKIRENKIK